MIKSSTLKSTYSAEEASARLGVSRATLYAYVSRGLLRSLPGDGATRARRYPKADVEALKRKRVERREPAAVAMAALTWGLPVLDSRITTIEAETLRYRGFDAIELAKTHSFEEVAALLIAGDLDERLHFEPATFEAGAARIASSKTRLEDARTPRRRVPIEGGIARAIEALARARLGDPEAEIAEGDARLRTACRTIGTFVSALAGGRTDDAAAIRLARHFTGSIELAPAIDRALVLCADHELNASSFVARCVASARGTTYDAVIAALCAFRGPRHGAAVLHVYDTIERVGTQRRAARIMQILRERRHMLAGFAHPLYPNGDPRARAILEDVTGLADPAALAVVRRIESVIKESEGLRPSVDFALGALAFCTKLPAAAAMEIFATGRTAGWMAHVLEQYAQPGLIRPRAGTPQISP